MADNKGGFPGHDEGTNKPPNASFYDSPGTFAPLQTDTSSVNTKSDLGTTGKVEGSK